MFANVEPEIRGAFISAAWAPTAFMLLKRGVLTKMIEAYPDLAYLGRRDRTTGESPVRYDLFQPMRDSEGYMIEEDLSFCARWRAIGGEIWLDGQGLLSHSMRVTKQCTTPLGEELISRVYGPQTPGPPPCTAGMYCGSDGPKDNQAAGI